MTMRHLFKILLIIFCLGVCWPASSDASLIGTTLFVSHRFPDDVTNVESYLVTVEPGIGDRNIFGLIYTSDPEADSLNVNFFRSFTFDNDPFNGHVGEFVSVPIQKIHIDTNLQGWDDSRLAYTPDSFKFNWAGLSAEQDTYFNAKFQFENSNPGNNHPSAPEPSTFWLF